MAGNIRLSSRQGLSQYLTGGCFKTPSKAWGMSTQSCCPYINLSASRMRRAVAAMMRRQGGHPEAIGSNRFERYATGRFHGPHCCVKTPLFYFWNGLFGLGRVRAGASCRARLSVWKACFIGSVQVQFGVSLLLSYNVRAFLANPIIHSLQYITISKNSLIWRGVLGSGICNIFFMA